MNIKLSDIQYAELRKLQRNMAGTPGYVMITCILMLHNGRSPQAVSEDLGISLSCVYRYVNQYQKAGVEELLNDGHKGYVGRLDHTQIAALRKELKSHF